jgi:hypothetical protein
MFACFTSLSYTTSVISVRVLDFVSRHPPSYNNNDNNKPAKAGQPE